MCIFLNNLYAQNTLRLNEIQKVPSQFSGENINIEKINGIPLHQENEKINENKKVIQESSIPTTQELIKEILSPDLQSKEFDSSYGISPNEHFTKDQKKEFYNNQLYGDYSEPLQEANEELNKAKSKRKLLQLDLQQKGEHFISSKKDIHSIAYLSNYLRPWKDIPTKKDDNLEEQDQSDKIQLNFENTDLKQFVNYLADLFKVTFIMDDDFDPTPLNGQNIAGHKITFKSHTPLSKKEVWDIGITFLEIAGFSVVPEQALERGYRILKSVPKSNHQPMPTFIGVDSDELPDSDIKVRYIYFVNNASLNTITKVINQMSSKSSSKAVAIEDIRALMLTDRSSNIKSMMKIIKELDTVTQPEVLTIIKLRRANAEQVANLFNKTLLSSDSASKRPFTWGQPSKKTSTIRYFSDRVKIVADKRLNSLIILGPQSAIARVEDFIVQHIDKEIDLPYAPLHIYKVKHLDAKSLSEILNNLVKFGSDTPAGQVGGVRNFDKYFSKSVQVFSEDSSNSIIIRANYEDYLKLKKTIIKLDIEQPQVALKLLILSLDYTNTKGLGAQVRSRKTDCNDGILDNISFQTGGLGSIVEKEDTSPTDLSGGTAYNPGAVRLLGNLLNLAQTEPTGSTLVSLGRDAFGVWGLLKIIETHLRSTIIAQPFLIATHKYPALLSVGQTRRVISGTVTSVSATTGLEDISANLAVRITPLISYDNMVTLNIFVELSNFTNDDVDSNQNNAGNRLRRYVETSALAADKEVLALGGFTINQTEEILRKVPVLSSMPLIGNFFTYKNKERRKRSILILIIPQIMWPGEQNQLDIYSQEKINEARRTMTMFNGYKNSRDPVYKWFFNDYQDKDVAEIDKFVSRQARYKKEIKEFKGYKSLEQNNKSDNQSLLDLIPNDNNKDE